MFVGKKPVPVLPIAIMISSVFFVLGGLLYWTDVVVGKGEGIPAAIVITFGLVAGPAAYYLLISSQRISLRQKVIAIEAEFKEALFQLGSSISGGAPIEAALGESAKRMEGLKIKDLFMRIGRNMRQFGMTFEQAIFDKNYGAVLWYPSVLIKSVLRAVVEASRKGVRTAAVTMMSIARYLRGLHKTQEEIRSSLSEVVSSLRFQAYMLSPLIAGVISMMAILIIRILSELGTKMTALGPGTATAGFLATLNPSNIAVSPFEFILIVSIYLIQSLWLLAWLMSGIESGEDPIGRAQKTGTILIIGTIVYIAALVMSLVIFSPLTTAAIA
jgi:hypothetical protein